MTAHQRAQTILYTLLPILRENENEHYAFIRPAHHAYIKKAVRSLERRLSNGEFSQNGIEQFQDHDFAPRT
jgi:hypothetical protein